jgi:hypothetical protein
LFRDDLPNTTTFLLLLLLTSDRLMISLTCCQCLQKESLTALLSVPLFEMSCVRREKLWRSGELRSQLISAHYCFVIALSLL